MRALPVVAGRRAFLRGLFFGPAADPPPSALVVVFLRGAADGLSMVVPYRDDDYRRLRPTLALPAPDRLAPVGRACLDLDGQFAFHPALAPLLPHWREGRLAAVHAAGSDDRTLSHFEAQDQMEHGTAFGQVASGGWLGRTLRARRAGAASGVRALAFMDTLPESLRGSPQAGALRSLDEIRISAPSGDADGVVRALEALHAEGEDLLPVSGRVVLDELRRLQGIRGPAGAGYPDHDFGRALSEVARLLRAEVGLEVACVDLGGFDTHFVQGGVEGSLSSNLAVLASGLDAFALDLGPLLGRTVVVVQTEFGRRAYENTALGTDHGRGSVMLLLGGGLRGGKVHGPWPGLAEDALENGNDLRVTTDYRQVLAEVLQRRCGVPSVETVFPGLEPRFPGVTE